VKTAGFYYILPVFYGRVALATKLNADIIKVSVYQIPTRRVIP
jgi:hypothetical protein